MTRPTSLRSAVASPYSVLGRTTGPAPSNRVASALEDLNAASGQLRDLLRQHHVAVREIRTAVSTDPNLTAEGRQNALRDRTATAAEHGMTNLAELKDRVDRAQRAIDDSVEANWPKPAAGVEGMLARQAAWSRARSLLEAGSATVTALIGETTDIETLYALRDELPTWARTRGANPATMETIVQRVDLQMGTAASGTSEVDLTARFEARAIVAALKPLLGQAEAEITGRIRFGDGLHAAIASHIARQATHAAHEPIIAADGSVL